ncbi:B3 domain-containing transcription factor FUS3 isoform X1 [Ziziphus jujuba]|uniref:B3 domain-containing transcription factor FUS3 isoform X1 n=1 Tax=Ziziphus jujuba TaxID=326968 RepID=A0ABM3IXL6_ZIZJJ|nr:B3 domain-containing transcription factor FUS3 isoform X1 [Ziziphus jujuba]
MMMMMMEQTAVASQQGAVHVKHDKPEASTTTTTTTTCTTVGLVDGDKTRRLSDRTGSTRDLVAAVTSFGVHRKKRMARQRRSSSSLLNHLHLSFAAAATTSSSPSLPHVPFPSSSSLPLSSARVIDPRRLRFLFQKELRNSDVSSLRRMILPKKAAEAHLPVLESKEGIFISMDDMDGLHVWSFKYRFWPNNNSRMYVLENTGEFVSTHGLRLGDFIMVYQDNQNHNYVIEAKKATDEEDLYGDISKSSSEIVVKEELLLHDYEAAANNYCRSSSASSFYMHYDPVVVDVESGTGNSNNNMSFVYDTTTNFPNDSLLDFLGGSDAMSTNYSRNWGLESFGSVENFCLDDYY